MFVYKINHIPVGKVKRTGQKSDKSVIIVHNTANLKSSAQNERDNLARAGNTRNASFHIVVDDHEAIECIPLNERSISTSSATANDVGISVEVCESGNYPMCEQNAAALIAKLLKERGWGIERITTHRDWTGKDCPRRILTHWDAFVKMVVERMNDVTEAQVREIVEAVLKEKQPPVPDSVPNKWAEGDILWAKENGVMTGDSHGDLRLHSSVTREELTVVAHRLADVVEKNTLSKVLEALQK